MNIPGFTAGTSLYKTSGRYQITSTVHNMTFNSNEVQPALAIYVDGRYVCNGEVTENGFINCDPLGSGGGGSRPDPSDLACIRCHRDCNKKPFAQRAACHADCVDLIC